MGEKFVSIDWGTHIKFYQTTLTKDEFETVYNAYNEMYGRNVYTRTFDDFIYHLNLERKIAPIALSYKIGVE